MIDAVRECLHLRRSGKSLRNDLFLKSWRSNRPRNTLEDIFSKNGWVSICRHVLLYYFIYTSCTFGELTDLMPTSFSTSQPTIGWCILVCVCIVKFSILTYYNTNVYKHIHTHIVGVVTIISSQAVLSIWSYVKLCYFSFKQS